MNTELANVAGPAALAHTAGGSRPLILAERLSQETEQRKLLLQYVAANMVEGVDFGVIPGTGGGNAEGKKNLLKPGAEKITGLYRCMARFIIVKEIEDFDKPLFMYRIRCEIVSLDSGNVVAEGQGTCSSRESKYRYRNSDRVCPECGKPAIKTSKYPPRGAPAGTRPGFYCFSKLGGCGLEFAAEDTAITGQVLGKVDNPDVADQQNTILKMAKKRSHVDAAIMLAQCSEMFTQDAEDLPDAPPPAAAPAAAPARVFTMEEFKAELIRTGASWRFALENMNRFGAKYSPDTVKAFELLDPRHVAGFMERAAAWPTKPAKAPAKSEGYAGHFERIQHCKTGNELEVARDLLKIAKNVTEDERAELGEILGAKLSEIQGDNPTAAQESVLNGFLSDLAAVQDRGQLEDIRAYAANDADKMTPAQNRELAVQINKIAAAFN